jgi:condensin complex subunit 2
MADEERPRKRAKRLSLGHALRENDDAAEKEERRAREEHTEPVSVASRKKALAPPTGQTQAQAKPPTQDIQTTLELYSKNVCSAQWLRLTHSQKINQKNTWQLKLIDYITDIVKDVQVEERNDTFQNYSTMLDATVKIYATRVDSVHVDTYKMLGLYHSTKLEIDST